MELKRQEKYFIGKYFLKEFMKVKREELEEPVTFDIYMAEIIRNSLQGKETEVFLDEIYESGAVINHAGKDISDRLKILKRYIELYIDNEDEYPSAKDILDMTWGVEVLIKSYLYEIAHFVARRNGISVSDTITEYDFGRMIYNELKGSEVEGYFIYELDFIGKEFYF